MVPIWVSDPIGSPSPRRTFSTPAMKVVATAPSPTSITPSFPLGGAIDRKSTRLNSSHSQISYAVFCLKKKKKKKNNKTNTNETQKPQQTTDHSIHSTHTA